MRKFLTGGGFALFLCLRLGWADPAPLPADPAILAQVNQINQDSLSADVNALVNFYTRHTFSDTLSLSRGIGAARSWLLNRNAQMGLSAQFFGWEALWLGNWYDCYNVHATLPGSGGVDPIIVVGAHYDTRTVSASNTTGFAPGADDDGSGVAALLEMGRNLITLPLSTALVTAAFAGEEQGLYGSEAYVNYLVNADTDVKGMIALDMIGHIVYPNGVYDSTTVRCYSGGPQGSTSRQLARYVKWVGESYSNGLTVTLYNAIDRPGRGSDHIPFYEAGYPSCRLIETAEDEAYQHDTTDVPTHMSFSYARKVARLATGVAAALATSPEAPPAPIVTNYGDGQTLLVSWQDTLVPPGGTVYVAFREDDQLYWENAIAVAASPLTVSGLTEGQLYEFSLSIADEPNRPSPFSAETPIIPQVAPPPEHFETTSTIGGVALTWSPVSEPTATQYVIERAVPGGAFSIINFISLPDTSWFDLSVSPHQLYLYRLKTQNNLGYTGSPTLEQEGQLATHDLGILIVDATPDGPGVPNQPTDEEVDSFYSAVLEPYPVAGQWDRVDSAFSSGATISDADLAPYNLVLVHADHYSASLGADTTAWLKYLDNGGKLLLVGWRLSASIMGNQAFAQSYSPGDFFWDLAGIDSLQVVPPAQFEFTGVQGQNGYPDLTFDAVRFPTWLGGLFYIDAFWTETFPGGVEVIGTFQAASGSSYPFHDRPVALRGGGSSPAWVLLEAPGFYLTPTSATAYLRQAIDELSAPTGIAESEPETFPLGFGLAAPHPNPFNPTTAISYQLSANSFVNLVVYDVSGRSVARLVNERETAGEHRVLFDGTNLASGIYLVKLEAGEFQQTRKVVLLK